MVPLALCHIFETVASIKDRFQTLELFTLNVHFWDSQVPKTHSQEILSGTCPPLRVLIAQKMKDKKGTRANKLLSESKAIARKG